MSYAPNSNRSETGFWPEGGDDGATEVEIRAAELFEAGGMHWNAAVQKAIAERRDRRGAEGLRAWNEREGGS